MINCFFSCQTCKCAPFSITHCVETSLRNKEIVDQETYCIFPISVKLQLWYESDAAMIGVQWPAISNLFTSLSVSLGLSFSEQGYQQRLSGYDTTWVIHWMVWYKDHNFVKILYCPLWTYNSYLSINIFLLFFVESREKSAKEYPFFFKSLPWDSSCFVKNAHAQMSILDLILILYIKYGI